MKNLLFVGLLMVVTACNASLEVRGSGGVRKIPIYPSTRLVIDVYNRCAPESRLHTPGAIDDAEIPYNDRHEVSYKPGFLETGDVIFSVEPFGDQYEYAVVQHRFHMRDFTHNTASWVIERVGNPGRGQPIRCVSRIVNTG